MLTTLDLTYEDTTLHKASVHEKAGPCPDPDCHCKDDGFRVKWNGERWVFMCRGCWDSQEILSPEVAKAIGKSHRIGEMRGWGDEIDYLRHYRKLSFQEAKALVYGEDGEDSTTRPAPVYKSTPYGYESDDWQKATRAAVQEHQDRLWSEDDTRALDYARSRGLQDDMIRWAWLGYSLKDGIPRLVIPSENDGRFVAVHCRDLRPDVPHNKRWMDAAGSSKDELYLADCLRRKLPTVLVESPLCALLILQVYGRERINAVATAGVKGAVHSVTALARLARMPIVLIALDADAAGDENAPYWLKCLSNARRLRPLLKDPGDMFLDGWDLRAWIDQAIEDTVAPAAPPESPTQVEMQQDMDLDLTDDGTAKELLERWARGGIILSAVDGQFMVQMCGDAETLPAEQFFGPASLKMLHTYKSALLDLLLPEQESDDPLYTYASTLSQIVDIFGGPGKVTISRHEPGLKLEQYARRIRKPYRPVSLPPLPRKRCPHRVLREKNIIRCKDKPLAHGWCELHQRSHELLCLGAVLGYPPVEVNQYRSISGGIANWEAYAECAPEKWLAPDIARMRLMFNYHEPLNLALPDDETTVEATKTVVGQEQLLSD